jgi:hypothetical protein
MEHVSKDDGFQTGIFDRFSPAAGRVGKVFLHLHCLCPYPFDISSKKPFRKWLQALEFGAEFLYKRDVIPNQHRDPF